MPKKSAAQSTTGSRKVIILLYSVLNFINFWKKKTHEILRSENTSAIRTRLTAGAN